LTIQNFGDAFSPPASPSPTPLLSHANVFGVACELLHADRSE